ncbi:MAG: SLBB domain-containing protein [Pseudomonadota bacterium]
MKVRDIVAALGLVFMCATTLPVGAQTPPAIIPAKPGTPVVAPAPADIPAPTYILGSQDVIQVDALGRSDFSTKARIGADGTVQLPFLGAFPAADRTTVQLRDQIAAALQKGGFFAKPIIQVEIVSFASRYVTVLGAVGSPGLVPVERPYRLSEILARVGGVRENGADYVILRSTKGPERTLQVKDLATGDESTDPYVQPGDKIFSPTAELFYVKGQVKAPGGYPLTTNMTLVMALARGGGITDLGSDSHIKIVRKNVTITPKDLNVKIEPNDVIDVGEGFF